jgi:hypothetical protein
MEISKEAARETRSFAMRHTTSYTYSAAPIKMIDGNSSPVWAGHSFCWKTKTGKPVFHPNAYRNAWGKPIYVPSTRHIVVGKDWIKQLEIDIIQVSLARKRGRFVAKELAAFIFYFGNNASQ